MDNNKVLKKLISTLSSYNSKQSSFVDLFEKNPVLSKAIEVFNDDIDSMIYLVFDQMGIPEEDEDNKYERKNWTRDVCFSLIHKAAKNDKYVEPAVELIADWKRLRDYTSKVDSHSWFYYDHLLEEHLTGYQAWHKQKRKE
ncbi:hypothetical protein [Alkalihalobacterium elongatum]|uniref:hypothetical protein n=1 Tax=Alkalihalobacterium elongatum TaxID=2675466 RepID=UPI001C1F74F1|nr:hypothetical protein [Alkalihalobacterium elongatum]